MAVYSSEQSSRIVESSQSVKYVKLEYTANISAVEKLASYDKVISEMRKVQRCLHKRGSLENVGKFVAGLGVKEALSNMKRVVAKALTE